MLRVTTLYAASAIATAAYYTRDLAQGPEEEPGWWLGRQSIGLELAGRVEADAAATANFRACREKPSQNLGWILDGTRSCRPY